jgi:hypothetical protein
MGYVLGRAGTQNGVALWVMCDIATYELVWSE